MQTCSEQGFPLKKQQAWLIVMFSLFRDETVGVFQTVRPHVFSCKTHSSPFRLRLKWRRCTCILTHSCAPGATLCPWNSVMQEGDTPVAFGVICCAIWQECGSSCFFFLVQLTLFGLREGSVGRIREESVGPHLMERWKFVLLLQSSDLVTSVVLAFESKTNRLTFPRSP